MPDYYHPYSESFLADPWPIYRRMRDEAPAYFVEDLNTWALSRFEDVWNVSMDTTHLTATRGTPLDSLMLGAPAPAVFAFMDPPLHTKHRNLIFPAYRSKSVAQLEEQVRSLTKELMRPFLAQGELEVYGLATKVALYVIADMIGLKRDEIERIRALLDIYYHRRPGVMGPTPEGLQAFMDIRAYTMELVRHYRNAPPAPDSHLAAWMSARIDDRPMTDEEIYFSIFVLTVTGSDTLALTSAGTLFYLHQHPEQLSAVRSDGSLVPMAFAETIRFDQPTNVLGRKIVNDMKLHGQTLRAGQNVIFLFASANRDEREFEEPERYRMTRAPKRTLSFGSGIHMCLGQYLARLEGRVLLEEILSALPEFDLDPSRCRRVFGEFLQGFCHVPLTFTPR